MSETEPGIAVAVPNENGAKKHQFSLTEGAMGRARLSFNPSGSERVNRLKALAAAFYSECDAIMAEFRAQAQAEAEAPADGGSIALGDKWAHVLNEAGREAATAKTHMQAAAMFAVSAATVTK